ncbi:aryl-sulfate sulfotransferase [Ligilactobacillus agilis]|uniref:aryl-sulfate sulfotransferase n=1 Tax=Ligilactobacillus agilis TaxID=1601 RepID=UPI0025A375DC|nr:aryl-sulfate sulfotransferase [Ligilactobacillus agilis]MDM8280957.1 aryl-sulfate sulfotransferase [Ligilactobacillus agilis]
MNLQLKRKLFLLVFGLAVVTLTTSLIFVKQKASSNATSSETILPVANGQTVTTLDYSDLNIKSVSDIYQTATQTKIAQKIKQLEASQTYSFDKMLVLANPYLTNTTGLYLHFSTTKATKISYTVKSKGTSTFSQTLYNPNGTYAKNHTYQLIGLIAGQENTITITATDQNGQKETKTFTYTPNKLRGSKQNQLKVTKGTSKTKLSTGLYTVIGDKSLKTRNTYLVDNDGYIRAEIPTINYNSLCLIQTNNKLYLAVDDDQIVTLDRLGQVVQSYSLKDTNFKLHHDFAVDSQGNIIALATDTKLKASEKRVEDQIIKIDGTSGQVSRLLDFKDLLGDLYKTATGIETLTNNKGYRDVIHANTIQLTKDDQVIISSRETSTIMKISNLTSQPKLDYFISDSSVWQGVGTYSNLLLNKVGNFTSQAGQHSVTYIPTETAGVYYLEMFNNNSAIMNSRTNFSWANYPNSGGATASNDYQSSYYKYLVNENTGSYQLVKKISLPYSPFISSVQTKDNNVVTDSGMTATFAEYDADGKLIQSFETTGSTKFIYRVYKYDFNNFYFAN